jgi:hypothetical protein
MQDRQKLAFVKQWMALFKNCNGGTCVTRLFPAIPARRGQPYTGNGGGGGGEATGARPKSRSRCIATTFYKHSWIHFPNTLNTHALQAMYLTCISNAFQSAHTMHLHMFHTHSKPHAQYIGNTLHPMHLTCISNKFESHEQCIGNTLHPMHLACISNKCESHEQCIGNTFLPIYLACILNVFKTTYNNVFLIIHCVYNASCTCFTHIPNHIYNALVTHCTWCVSRVFQTYSKPYTFNKYFWIHL